VCFKGGCGTREEYLWGCYTVVKWRVEGKGPKGRQAFKKKWEKISFNFGISSSRKS
jgi:hypothetical protein